MANYHDDFDFSEKNLYIASALGVVFGGILGSVGLGVIGGVMGGPLGAVIGLVAGLFIGGGAGYGIAEITTYFMRYFAPSDAPVPVQNDVKRSSYEEMKSLGAGGLTAEQKQEQEQNPKSPADVAQPCPLSRSSSTLSDIPQPSAPVEQSSKVRFPS